MSFDIISRLRAAAGVPGDVIALADAKAARGKHQAAFELIARAARSGLPAAQYRLGKCYLTGQGVPASINDARRWLIRAGEAGDAAAQTQLAELALQGAHDRAGAGLLASDEPLQPDFQEAERWARLAVKGGSPEAMALLAFIRANGPADMRDEKSADALYEQSAAAGWPRGQLGLGLRRLKEGRVAEARELLEAAAREDIPIAHYWLGALTESTAAGYADLAKAASHYESAAEKGHAPSQMRFGFALLNGRGVPRDAFAAETWLRRAALGGEIQAAAVLGMMFAQNGSGDGSGDGNQPPNYAEAAVWLERAAEAGHPAAARTLGQICILGRVAGRNRSDAATWLRKAAEAGDGRARDLLVMLALTGEVSEGQASVTWLREAAERGDADAQFRLGLCFADGIGVSTDTTAARECFLRAARAGSPDAAAAAGEMLVNGRGGQRDVAGGLTLFRQAAVAGHAGALYALGVVLSIRDAIECAAQLGHPPAKLLLDRLQRAA